MDFSCSYHDFTKNGVSIIKDFLTPSEVNCLKNECDTIVDNYVPTDHGSIFHTSKNQFGDDYFLNSGDNISYFFEKGAVDDDGKLKVAKSRALNKVGHALHWLNPVFKKITFSEKVKNLLRCFDYKEPVLVQSMIIFKYPGIGGEVVPHQDSTYLYTNPPSAMGIWLPLDDVTEENGCLWYIPGSHKDGIFQRFVRNPEKNPLLLLKGELPIFDESQYVPILVNKGDCVLIHGSVIHKSVKNASNKPRLVYTYHLVESKDTKYSEENWLQPTERLQFPPVYST